MMILKLIDAEIDRMLRLPDEMFVMMVIFWQIWGWAFVLIVGQLAYDLAIGDLGEAGEMAWGLATVCVAPAALLEFDKIIDRLTAWRIAWLERKLAELEAMEGHRP